MREIGDAVGLSSLSSVTHQLNQLELSGYLRRDPNRPRALEVLIDLPQRRRDTRRRLPGRPVGDAAMVPLVGRIAAGIPITAEQQIDEVFPLPRQLVGKGDLFMLKVVGESMIDAAICDGDWVVVRQQKTRGERRDRRRDARRRGDRQGFRQRDGHTWLLPRNSSFEPILGDYAEILGKVVAVLRCGLDRLTTQGQPEPRAVGGRALPARRRWDDRARRRRPHRAGRLERCSAATRPSRRSRGSSGRSPG